MKSNLKPRKAQLLATLDTYRTNQRVILSQIEFSALSELSIAAESLINKLSRLALKNVSAELRNNFRFHFTAEESLSPKAATTGKKEFCRISIPLRFVQELLRIAATKNGVEPTSDDGYYRPSILIAILAAFAHELNHVFNAHLFSEASVGQETNSDYRAGGLVWVWLRRDDIRKTIDVSSADLDNALVYGVLHMVSIFNSGAADTDIYLSPISRWQMICGGAAFIADKKLNRSAGDRIRQAMHTMAKCPDTSYSSSQIEKAWSELKSSVTDDNVTAAANAIGQIQSEKPSWYQLSEHLRPIKKILMQVLKRDRGDRRQAAN